MPHEDGMEHVDPSLAALLKDIERRRKKRQPNVGTKVDGKDGQPKLPSAKDLTGTSAASRLLRDQLRGKPQDLDLLGHLPEEPVVFPGPPTSIGGRRGPGDAPSLGTLPAARTTSTLPTTSIDRLYGVELPPKEGAGFEEGKTTLSLEAKGLIADLQKKRDEGKISPSKFEDALKTITANDLRLSEEASDAAFKAFQDAEKKAKRSPRALNDAMQDYLTQTDPRRYSVANAKAFLASQGFPVPNPQEDPEIFKVFESDIKGILDAEKDALEAEADKKPAALRFDAGAASKVATGIISQWDPMKDSPDDKAIFDAFLAEGVLPPTFTFEESDAAWRLIANFTNSYLSLRSDVKNSQLQAEKDATRNALVARQNALMTGDLDALLQANKSYLAHGGALSDIENQVLRIDILKSFFQNPAYLVHAQIFGLLDELEMVLGMRFSVPDFRTMYSDKTPKSFGEWSRLSVEDPFQFGIMAQIEAAKQGLTPEQLFEQMKGRLPREIETVIPVREVAGA